VIATFVIFRRSTRRSEDSFGNQISSLSVFDDQGVAGAQPPIAAIFFIFVPFQVPSNRAEPCETGAAAGFVFATFGRDSSLEDVDLAECLRFGASDCCAAGVDFSSSTIGAGKFGAEMTKIPTIQTYRSTRFTFRFDQTTRIGSR
jgi:hypothetical protein